MEKVGAYEHPTGIAIWQEGGASHLSKGNNSFFFGKLNDREAHLSGKRICKPEALFANKSPFCTASLSHLPMQQKPCKVIMVATERQLKTIETQKANKPNSCLFPSKQTNRQK